MSKSEALPVTLSQESLFFPLPFTNAAIDNVVQIRNLLPAVPSNSKGNAVAFKILSPVQHRYSVRPPVGFIAAGDAVTVNFSFNPESVRRNKNPADRELPTAATKDAVYIDFAVVDGAAAEAVLTRWAPREKGVNLLREVQSDVAAFWKQRGPVKGVTSGAMRQKLRCVFAVRSEVPGSLVMCVKEEGGAAAPSRRSAPVEAPTSRPPSTSNTDKTNTAPPDSPPARYAENDRYTPTTSSTPLSRRRHVDPATPIHREAHVATLAPSSQSKSPPLPSTFPYSGSSPVAARGPMMTKATTTAKKKGMVAAVMHYKLSYKVVIVLLFLSFICGLLDRDNVLTWLIASK